MAGDVAPPEHDVRTERSRVLFEAAYPRIMAYALRRARNRDDALDVVSETFVVVWRRLDDVPEESGRAIAWVFGVARRVLANHYRSADRRSALETRLGSRPVADHDDGSLSSLVHQALASLKPRDREILTLAAWDDLDNEEIAEALAISPKGAAVRLHRARRRLAAQLEMLGVKTTETPANRVKSDGPTRTPDGVTDTPTGSGGEVS